MLEAKSRGHDRNKWESCPRQKYGVVWKTDYTVFAMSGFFSCLPPLIPVLLPVPEEEQGGEQGKSGGEGGRQEKGGGARLSNAVPHQGDGRDFGQGPGHGGQQIGQEGHPGGAQVHAGDIHGHDADDPQDEAEKQVAALIAPNEGAEPGVASQQLLDGLIPGAATPVVGDDRAQRIAQGIDQHCRRTGEKKAHRQL